MTAAFSSAPCCTSTLSMASSPTTRGSPVWLRMLRPAEASSSEPISSSCRFAPSLPDANPDEARYKPGLRSGGAPTGDAQARPNVALSRGGVDARIWLADDPECKIDADSSSALDPGEKQSETRRKEEAIDTAVGEPLSCSVRAAAACCPSASSEAPTAAARAARRESAPRLSSTSRRWTATRARVRGSVWSAEMTHVSRYACAPNGQTMHSRPRAPPPVPLTTPSPGSARA
mmetsp:Transcript_41006/g.94959  ORF Transcript_41006/g.94959 Transcript_41006/m.94959 type:complete len:232 (+) Transcript_41006:424-1119(+)